jgi:hypothetical protein
VILRGISDLFSEKRIEFNSSIENSRDASEIHFASEPFGDWLKARLPELLLHVANLNLRFVLRMILKCFRIV